MKSRILHAGFPSQTTAMAVREQLLLAGFTTDQISVFADTEPPPSDQLAQADSAATAEAPQAGDGALNGAVGGTALGIALGAVTSPLIGPLGVVTGGAVGGYVGSLVGALNQLDSPDEPQTSPQPPRWPWRVAVATPTTLQQCAALDLLTNAGEDLHDSIGQLVAGTWIDFNPADADGQQQLDAAAIARLRHQCVAST